VTRRTLMIVAILGHPLLFGVYFCLSAVLAQSGGRLLPALFGELLALILASVSLYRSLLWLQTQRYAFGAPMEDYLVHAVSLLYLGMIAVTIANSASLGLFATGSRLEYYFANDWYRRIVTFSYVPSMVATYHAVKALMSPISASRRMAMTTNLVLLFATSVLAGSKGAAVLGVATALGFTFSVNRIPVVRVAAIFCAAAAVYVLIFLYFTTDRYVTLLGIAQRFYLSIDMTILLSDPATAEVLASKLNGVWTEIFRNVNGLGGHISQLPIGGLIYDYVLGAPPRTGANCRFGSLLILYPDRLDFLLGFPLLAASTAYVVRELLIAVGLRQAARVGACCFLFQSFQDVYWWASHVIPLVLCFGLMLIARAVTNASLNHTSDAA
jgi:hypothetical protein